MYIQVVFVHHVDIMSASCQHLSVSCRYHVGIMSVSCRYHVDIRVHMYICCHVRSDDMVVCVFVCVFVCMCGWKAVRGGLPSSPHSPHPSRPPLSLRMVVVCAWFSLKFTRTYVFSLSTFVVCVVPFSPYDSVSNFHPKCRNDGIQRHAILLT